MTRWLPDSWRHTAARLRDDIHRVLDRWWSRHEPQDAPRELEVVDEGHTAARLRNDIHRALDRWWPRYMQQDRAWEPAAISKAHPWISPWGVFAGAPALDIEENDDEIIVTADLPGLHKDEYAVEISGGRLILRGEKKHTSEQRGRGYYYAERSYGAFTRTVPLPCEVDAQQARARYERGVLRITLPKTAQAKAKRIHVRVK